MKKEISAAFPFESKYLEVKGSKIHYIDEGEGDPANGWMQALANFMGNAAGKPPSAGSSTDHASVTKP